MSGTLEFLDVINAHGGTISTVVMEEIISGTSAVVDVVALFSAGGVVSSINPLPVTDEGAISQLGSLVSQLGGTLHTSSTALAPLNYSASSSATVGTTSGPLVNAALYTRSLVLTTDLASTGDVYLDPSGGTAALKAGIPLGGGGGQVIFGSSDLPMPTGTITAISNSGPVTVSIAGG